MVHLVKLCVGIESLNQLAQRLEWRVAEAPKGQPALTHVTRMFPKREAELLNGGSLYWVIKGAIQARQRIVALDEVTGSDGIRRCRIVLDDVLIATKNQPRRPFQGWRYLADDDAPADIGPYEPHGDDMPEEMRADLVRLGLL